MQTQAEHNLRMMRALFDHAGIKHESMVECLREALGDRVASNAEKEAAVNPGTGLNRPRVKPEG